MRNIKNFKFFFNSLSLYFSLQHLLKQTLTLDICKESFDCYEINVYIVDV